MAQERARRVERLPVSQARSGLLGPSRAAQQRYLHASRPKHLGRLGERRLDEPQTRGGAVLTRREAAELQERRGSPARQRSGLVPGEAGLLCLAERQLGEAQVVEGLGVVALPRHRLRQGKGGLVVALELHGETSRGPVELGALGEGRERRRVDVVGLEQLAVQLLVAAELHPVALAPRLARREDVGRLRAGLHLRLRHDVVPALGVGDEHAAGRVTDLNRVGTGGRQVGIRRLEDAGGSEAQGDLAHRRRPARITTRPPRTARVRLSPTRSALPSPGARARRLRRWRASSRRSSAPAGRSRESAAAAAARGRRRSPGSGRDPPGPRGRRSRRPRAHGASPCPRRPSPSDQIFLPGMSWWSATCTMPDSVCGW